MSEEAKQPETQGQPATESSAEVPASLVREHPLFQKLASELKSMKGELENKALTERQKQEEIALKKLEEKQEYETIINKYKEDMESLRTTYEQKMLHKDLKLALSSAGLTNEIALKGALSSFEGSADDISTFVETLVESNPELFQKSQKTKLASLTMTAPSMRADSNTSWKDVYSKWVPGSRDPESQNAEKMIRDYHTEHGHMPPKA